MPKKAFGCHKLNTFALHFDNGNWLSTVWGACTYSENYNESIFDKPFQSNTVEIMFSCPDKLRKKILKKYNEGNDDPIGYLTISQWYEIVKLLGK